MKIFRSQNYGSQSGYLHDTPVNQFLIDPISTWLCGLVYSEIFKIGHDIEIKEFPYLLAATRLLSSIIYNSVADKNENNISRFFRDYIMPPALAAGVGYIYGLSVDQNLALTAAMITGISELLTDVIEYRLERRFKK
ncbi:MAG: hypothetical protein N3D75_04435 [Candidatus Aenigmarchaeota archaeon]|nr:hypothetical protein [Candidatus Aenigmarchaeota archaeon]